MATSIHAPPSASASGSVSGSSELPSNGHAHGHDEEDEAGGGQAEVRKNPYLLEPMLHVSGVDPTSTDRELASGVFGSVLPVRLKIDRDVEPGSPASGTVEFQTLEKAEKAYATLRNPQLNLTISVDSPDPKPTAKPRLVKQLPAHTDDAMLFDLFRSYGPLARAQCILTNPAGQHTGFRGMAFLEYYFEEDAQSAQNEMHCAEIGGKTISVAVDNVARRPSGQEFSPSAAPFVPGGSGFGRSMNASAPAFSPPQRQASGSAASIYATPAATHQQAGPIIPVPGTNLQYSASAATYIDPCNLFCKNLDPNVSSNDLFTAFKPFGRIVSARVMRDQEGYSREFGFVSFTQADDASRALHSMNNAMLGNKQMTVRLHEPKKMRQEKLAAKFGASTPRNGEQGSESPPLGDGASSETAGSPSGTPTTDAAQKKADRRQSNSYFKAAMANESASVDIDTFAALSTGVRNEVLAGEFNKRVKDLPTVKSGQVDGIVGELLKLKLAEAVEALNNPIELIQRVTDARDNLPQSPPAPASSGLLSPMVHSNSNDGASMMSSAPASGKERERLLKAVTSVSPTGGLVEDITDMLVSLPKKERALCLFNVDYLKQKVEEAREILDITEDDGEEVAGAPENVKAVKDAPIAIASPTIPAAAPAAADSAVAASTAEPAKASVSEPHTLASLSRLPALEIVKLASNPPAAGLPLPKADASKVRETDAFIDSLSGKPIHDQKQKVGDKLFKVIRGFGVKGAPKITIALLDSEDLRALAHLMEEYPEVLREKVNLQIANK